MIDWTVAALNWAAVVVLTLRLMPAGDDDDMTEEAVTRAIQSAAREAFAMGLRAKGVRGSEVQQMKDKAVSYAEELVLPMVGIAIQEALEQQWIQDHGKRHSAPDPTL